MTADPEHRVPHLGFQPNQLNDINILPIADVETAYYLRISALDEPGVLSKITQILSDAGISVEAVIQKGRKAGQNHVPLVMLTSRAIEKKLDDAVDRIQSLSAIAKDVVRIRVESLG
ncbi:MAG: ACT domain-containing protein [Porticoccaceae bacterium]